MKKLISGTWANDKYSIYERNAPTFENTISLAIYSDGTDIDSYKFYGNCSQASTPTPSSPVAVECFGDLIASGDNAGKYDIPIASGGVTNHIILSEPLRKIGDYADTVDSEGVVTRRIGKYSITDGLSLSSYTLSASGIGASINMPSMLNNARLLGICSHFEPQNSPSGSALDGVTFGVTNTRIYFTFSTATATALNLTNITSIRAWFDSQYTNGTPVTVYYVLETPTTESITAPTIPTSSGYSNVEIGTSLAPSKVELDMGKMFVPKVEKVRVNGAWV